MSNIWGNNTFPDFLHYVGTIHIESDHAIQRGNNFLLIQKSTPSKEEKNFFEDVTFYKVEDKGSLRKNDFGYIQLADAVFDEVTSCLKQKADYMMSASSIYKTRKLNDIPDHPQQTSCSNQVLDQKLRDSRDGFIRPEERFKYLRMKGMLNNGEVT